jgi:hypothetical protein
MRRSSFPTIRTVGVVLALGAVLFAPSASRGQAAHERTPVATTPHFAFYSDFATNLNDALIAAGLARKRAEPELFHAGAEVACFGELPPSARAGWERAVDYYAEIISPGRFDDRPQFLVRMHLAGFDEETRDDPGAGQFNDLAGAFLAAATPAYEACRWPAQDAANRRWVEELIPRLAAHEPKIAPRLEELYQRPWTGLPIRFDVVETVDWSGANTIIRSPTGGHTLISTSNQGLTALEVVFHEASHLLMDRGDPLQKALAEAAKEHGVALPRDLWHLVLFYTTGETVRQALGQAGEPGYTPMLVEIFSRSKAWARYREALESTWPAYLDGKRTLSEAAGDLIQALPEPEKPKGNQ